MAKTPKIRFKNFSDEWVESRLGELGETYSGLSGKTKNDFGRGNAKYITYLNVFSNSIADIKLTEPIEKDEKQNQVKFGDVLFTTSSETPNEVGMSSVWLGNFQNCYLNSFCFGYRLTQKINHYYLAYLLRSENIRNKIILLAQGISRYNISKNKMMDISISIPNLTEQEKIGAFFSKLDKLISLHQSKFEKLQKIKKSCLQNLFPQNNQNTPKIRFTSFSKPWETRKFSDTFIFLQNNSLSRAELSNLDGEIINIHYGDILIKYTEILNIKTNDLTYILDNSIIKKYQASTLQNGDIIIADAAEDQTVGKCSEITGLTNEVVLSGLHTIPCRPNEKHANGFLGYYMNSNVYHDQLLPLLQGTKVLSISKSALQNTDIIYPSNLAEQCKISDFFSKLDKLISLHQSKFEKLQKIKKSCLQNMFV